MKVSAAVRAVSAGPVLRFSGGVVRDPAVESWFSRQPADLRRLVRPWFELMRACGSDVRELIHDGCPTACVEDAGFGYVNAYSAHAATGFFRGAVLPDPLSLLEGTGKLGRHVKLRRGFDIDAAGLQAIISAAYREVRERLAAEALNGTNGTTQPRVKRRITMR